MIRDKLSPAALQDLNHIVAQAQSAPAAPGPSDSVRRLQVSWLVHQLDQSDLDLPALRPTQQLLAGIVEPRGVWDGSEDSVLVDLNTKETLGTAASLLGVRGWVYGAVGAHLRVQTKGGDHVVVGQDGVVHLTVPAHLDWDGHNNRTSAYSEGRLLHTDRADDGALVLSGMDGDGVISTLASGCGETPIAIRDVVTFTFDGAPYLLVKHTTGDLLGYTELSVYPLLPMP